MASEFWQTLRQNGGVLTWKGRLNRKRYLLRNMAINAAATGIDRLLMRTDDLGIALLFLAISLFLILLMVLNVIKRFHDLDISGKPGAFYCALVFLLGLFDEVLFAPGDFLYGRAYLLFLPVSLYLLFKKGTEGKNKYGDDPLANEEEASPT